MSKATATALVTGGAKRIGRAIVEGSGAGVGARGGGTTDSIARNQPWASLS